MDTDTRQVVTFTLFHLHGRKNRWWAFRHMGLYPPLLEQVAGLEFAKMVGSGAGTGFSILPNLGVYGLLGVWTAEAAAQRFFESDPVFQEFKHRGLYQTFFLHTVKSHGSWDGKSPFRTGAEADDSRPIAVLTRATIAPRQLWRFWAYVPPVSKSIEKFRAHLLLAVGIGELPLVQQATFSLWRDPRQMMAYAYQSPEHRGVVKKTRELGWYSEELFARFRPYRFEGSGENPLEGLI